MSQRISALSRRDVLIAAGTAMTGVAGLSQTVDGKPSPSVTVARDRMLAPISDDLDAPFRQDDAALSISTVGTGEGFERFLDRDVDVFHATRPMLPSETASAKADGLGYETFESVVDGAALLRPPERWRPLLSTDRLEKLRASTSESQTWAELVPPDASSERPKTSTAIDSEAPTTDDFGSETDRLGADYLPDDATPLVVRGVRANQYAVGHGGLGYYETIGEKLTTAKASADAADSLVGRLRYTYVNADALRRESVTSFVQLFGARARQTLAGVVPFADDTASFTPFDGRRASL